jgi:putative OmpL-like beta-barrel porin-2
MSLARSTTAVLTALVIFGSVSPALAQKSVSELLGREATPEGKPKSYLEELSLYGYIEQSYVWNLGRTGRRDVNELRFYDVDAGYTFNAAEISVKKDPSERYRIGYGVVVTAGLDSQKNHSLGVFRDADDSAPLYWNTAKVDLPEVYGSYLVPLGNGLTLKAGKWATLIGYEGYETPKNLNFSRSFLYTLGTPYTHTGVLATYPFTSWFSLTLGFTNGWDNADNNNGYLRPIGSFAFTPMDKLTATTSFLVGPEQNRSQMRGDRIDNRWIVDTTILYTGIDKWTLGVNFDFAGEEREPTLASTRNNGDASWGGIAGYVGYDWTTALQTMLRVEYFADVSGVKNGILPPGQRLNLYEVTATGTYKIWKGLLGRLEYRHDAASDKVFSLQNHGTTPTSTAQNTITFVLDYVFP